MKEKQELNLLREYVKEIITEDDGGDVAADLMANATGASPYGMSYGGRSVMSVFVTPFLDVFKVGAGKTKELAVRTQTLARVAFETIVTTVMPIFSDDYAKIFANEKKQLDNIKREYQEVYSAVWEVFDKNDVKLLAFMYDPFAAGAMMAYFGGKVGVSAAIGAVDAMTGGWLKDNFDIKAPRKKHRPSSGGHSGRGGHGGGHGGGYGDGGGGGVQSEGILRLAESRVTGKVIKKAMEHPQVQAMRQKAAVVIRGTLDSVLEQANQVLSSSSLQQLVSGSGESSARAKQALDQLQQVPEADRKNAEALLLKTLKQSFKAFYLKNLEGQVSTAVQSGVPKNSAYVKEYVQVMNKIKSM